ncbi:tRNA 2-thiouridine(34) synthase MnmA [bacterium]|nr:tRNA 2-thiouridine(34) synthase MnmA [bacterium]|tara:strand:+ start:492 stop:1622 length:1131 start_codon:yes stop_codon:yes gene_type:complete
MKKTINKGKSVLVALSGGVDSSVAAFLLQKQGYNVSGSFIKCFNIDGCAVTDAEDARRVASHLNIPFYTFDFEKEYKKRVVEYMIKEYKAGRTPNPDVMCNKMVKFDLFLKQAKKMDFDFIATGHYSRLRRNNQFSIPNFQLLAAHDSAKDQTYFLWTLTQNILKQCLFPIGDYKKSEVREIARKANLPTAEKKDSQGICFLGKISIMDFLKKYIKAKDGDVLNTKGDIIGTHDGAAFYTIGQRHGFTIKTKDTKTKPRYIAEKNVKTNTLIVAEANDPALSKKELTLTNLNFINPKNHTPIRANGGNEVFVRIRYRQPLQKAKLMKLSASAKGGSASGGKSYKLIFDSNQKFIASGQSAVFYSKTGELLGGGIIA